MQLLNPKGIIAFQESHMISTALILMLIIVIPVFIMTFWISYKYRVANKSSKFTPNSENSKNFQSLLWGVPTIIIAILAVLTWKTSHQLDPFKPLSSTKPPITIQVVALQWKWLFIYPQQNIATINFIQFPAGTPIDFQLTADAPMNSFWIPQLGGQMYAMPGMGTHLHLMADAPGDFNGSAAEISGQGFAGMKFIARASSQSDFDNWISQVKQSPKSLNLTEYNKLSSPSEDNPVATYAWAQKNLYDLVMAKFMSPSQTK